MKSSILIIFWFCIGIGVGLFHWVPKNISLNDISLYVLYILIFLVGISLGMDKRVWVQLRRMNIKILLIPVTSVIGTIAGILIYKVFFKSPNLTHSLAIGAGLGYYSFSSIYLSKIAGESIGIIALLSNIFREILTLIFAPWFVKYFGKIAPIVVGGATTSDTTLPVILKFSGKEYVVSSVVNGIILTLLVPFFLTIIYSF